MFGYSETNRHDILLVTFHIDQAANSCGWDQSYWGEGKLVSDRRGGGYLCRIHPQSHCTFTSVGRPSR